MTSVRDQLLIDDAKAIIELCDKLEGVPDYPSGSDGWRELLETTEQAADDLAERTEVFARRVIERLEKEES